MIHTFDEANFLVNKDIISLNEDKLTDLVEFFIRKGLVSKIDKNGASFEWSEATKNIMTLIKHLIIQVVKE